jgi:hypothetical protein
MGRLVDPIPRGARAFSKGSKDNLKQYIERVIKYIPAEIVAGYLFLTQLVEARFDAGTSGREGWLWAALVVGVLFTPLYLSRADDPNKPKRLHMVIGTIAFVVWTYATKGAWIEGDIYDPLVAAFALVIFTWGVGFVAPTEGTK